MSETPTVQMARELIDTLLKEAEEKLLAMMAEVAQAEIENGNVTIARCLFVERPDKTFALSPAAQVMVEMGHADVVKRAGELLVEDFTRREAEHLQSREGDGTKVN